MSRGVCQTAGFMHGEREHQDDPIDESLLDCFLELSLRERIRAAANYANAVTRLRRIRPADDPEQTA